MKIGYRVENEYTGFEPVFYCGDCLDSTNGVTPLAEVDTDRQCVYCSALLVTFEELSDSAEEPEDDEPETGSVQYAEGFVFVNVYEVDRLYGGPEEGGWWYDAGQLITSRQVTEESALDMKLSLQIKYPETGGSSSVFYSGGDYRVWIEDHPGADYPESRPMYE